MSTLTKKSNKPESIEEYWDVSVVEDEDDIITILESASTSIAHIIGFKSTVEKDDPNFYEKNRDSMKIWGAIFVVTFETIIEAFQDMILGKFTTEVSDKPICYDSYNISFADRCDIGFASKTDPEDEKEGNFMIYIYHKNINHAPVVHDDARATSAEKACKWNIDNIKENSSVIKIISERAKQRLSEIDIQLQSWEFVPPLFAAIYDALISFMMIRQAELNEPSFKINWLNCFRVEVQDQGDELTFTFTPDPANKLALKNDGKITATKE